MTREKLEKDLERYWPPGRVSLRRLYRIQGGNRPAICAQNIFQAASGKIQSAIAAGVLALLSYWVWAFQMGRECEPWLAENEETVGRDKVQ